MMVSNKIMAGLLGIGMVTLLVASGVAQAGKDPATRDEDISGTEVKVSYHQRSDGLWVYEYSETAPESNKGTVTTFAIDLHCGVSFNDVSLPYPPSDREGYEGVNNSAPVTPAAPQCDWGACAVWGIDALNTASWLLSLKPGEHLAYQRLVSPAAPGWRQYTLDPAFEVVGWNYPRIPDPTLPQRKDFIVNGVIAAPGCPGEVPPVKKPSFPGTLFPTERDEDLNGLLSYTKPLKDRVRVAEGTKVVELAIRYRDDLDPKSFKVQPGWAQRYFHPKPGTEETVRLPLKQHKTRNRFFLEAHPVKASLPRAGSEEHDPPAHARKDRDEFEFRVESGN